MSTRSVRKDEPIVPRTTERSEKPPVIYADRIYNVAIGASISKLHLGVEVEPNLYDAVGIIAIPTPQMIEAFEFILGKLDTEEPVRTSMLQSLQQFKSRFDGPTSKV